VDVLSILLNVPSHHAAKYNLHVKIGSAHAATIVKSQLYKHMRYPVYWNVRCMHRTVVHHSIAATKEV
jgi:uncharacterized membrane protein required for colicin V production